VSGNIGRAFAY